jgi:parallel beta-helix repeat protein
MKHIRLLFILFVLAAAPCAVGTIIRVPQDQPTIQDGINAANNGDTVLVSPGTYYENIDFKGKAITVRSSGGAGVTTIDGGKVAQVVTFDSGEIQSSVLKGFTIRNGFPSSNSFPAGGISIGNSSPSIIHNVITQNGGCGIAVYYGAPVIENNTVSYNSGDDCNPAEGTGILLYGQGTQYGMGSVQIIGNRIVHNVAAPDGNGAGIYLWIGGAPLIQNNIIAFNQAGTYSSGGGITMQNSGAPVIVQNLIVGNKAGTVGGGLDLEIPNDGSTALMVNNTIADNSTANENQGPTGPEVYVSGFYGTMAFWNNIFAGATENAVVYCDPLYGAPSPSFNNNDAFSAKGGDYAGACAGETGQNGNISANPKFVNPTKRNFQLRRGSPAINAGSNSAPDIPKKDLAGHKRIVGGIIDMEAYEYQGK